MSPQDEKQPFAKTLRRLSAINGIAFITLAVLCVLGLIFFEAELRWQPIVLGALTALVAALMFVQARLSHTTARQLQQETVRLLQARQETINRYHSLFEYANDSIYLVDAQTHRFLEVNQNVVKRLGYSRDELLSMTVDDINAPETWVELPAIFNMLQANRSAVYERVHVRKDGTRMPVEISSRLIEYGSRAVIQSFARDITERRLAEQKLRDNEARYRSVIEALSEGVVVYNANAAMETWNQSAERILGLTLSGGAEDGYRLLNPRWQAVREDGTPFLTYPAAVTLRTGEAQTNVVMGLKRPDTSDMTWLTVNSEPLYRPGEALPYGAVASFIDITEARRVNEELARARDEAVEIARAKTAFLATMSHELRTPMNGVIGMIDLLLETPLTDRQREMIEVIRTSGQTLLAIINDTLDYSKIEARRMVLEQRHFEPLEIIENVADLLGPEARHKGLSLMTFVDPAIPRILIGDSMRLHQIVLNLVGNAVKFTESGEVAVQTNLERLDEKRATLYCSVSDTGVGISEAARQRIFAPFIQGDDSMTRKYGGTGLGLAICKRLIDLMDGEIGLESVLGQGSTFWFRVALTLPSADASTRSESIERNVLRGQKVLIVDDSPMARGILNRYVTDFGASSASASDGAGALSLLRQAHAAGEPFNAVIIDLIMPGIDGMALASVIKQDAALAYTPLILLSATPNTEQAEQALAAGFVVFLSKPVKQPELLDALLAVLESSLASQESEHSEQNGTMTPAATGRPASAWRILLVEDNPTNQRVLALQLEKLGYHPQIVDNGQQALVALAVTPYDLVLMDCQMPDMDGFETTRRIRRAENGHARHIPIVALTANALDGDREQCLAAGMDDYITKPIRLKQLHTVITHWLPSAESADSSETLASASEQSVAAELAHVPTLDLKILAELSTLGKGNPAVLGRLIDIFLENTPKSLATLRTALVQTDAGSLRLTAHSLKSSSASYGATRLSNLCKELEVAARQNAWKDVAAQIYQKTLCGIG
ncbi:MAG: response regulator [Aggregatilineales bacterium]